MPYFTDAELRFIQPIIGDAIWAAREAGDDSAADQGAALLAETSLDEPRISREYLRWLIAEVRDRYEGENGAAECVEQLSRLERATRSFTEEELLGMREDFRRRHHSRSPFSRVLERLKRRDR